MRNDNGFNEVMIVNPIDPRFVNTNRGERFMFYNLEPPGMGYYAEPPDEYGYFAEGPGYDYYGEAPPLYPDPGIAYGMGDPYGYYGEPPEMVGWGEPYEYGEIEPGYSPYQAMGYFAEDYPAGYYGDYGEEYQLEEYYEPSPPGQPFGYFAEDYPYGPYGEYNPPREDYYRMSEYPERGMEGYVRETEPGANARCLIPIIPVRSRGLGEDRELEGYVAPKSVNAKCERFEPQPVSKASEPDTFKPLW